jgi:hypothetical protein
MRAAAAMLVLLYLAAGGAMAARLDDSASPKRRLDLQSRWLHNDERLSDPERLNAMVAAMGNVEVRLNTAAYVGKRGRIYLALPQFIAGLQSPSALRVEWRAHRLFQSGSALPGERALLYDGPITQPMMSEIFDFNVYIDARLVGSALRFDPAFDIDLVP